MAYKFNVFTGSFDYYEPALPAGTPTLISADTTYTLAENYSQYSVTPMRIDGTLRINGVLTVAGE